MRKRPRRRRRNFRILRMARRSRPSEGTFASKEQRVLTGGSMSNTQTLVPAQTLAGTNQARHPNESAEYRAARNALLAEEIELRRHIERVASQRRVLPPGGQVPRDFEFISESGSTSLSSIFGEKDTLMVYSMM